MPFILISKSDLVKIELEGYNYTDFRELGMVAHSTTADGHYYSRLPASAQHDVTAEVWSLAMMSTNQYVRSQ